MREAWSADLTYDYLGRLIDAMRARFKLRLLRDGPPRSGDPMRAILRHDIDVSLQRALALAEREAQWGVRATYLLQVDCPLYRVDDPQGRDAIAALTDLGHEVGLHVDVGGLATGELERRMVDARDRLEALVGAPVRSVSFHRPAVRLLRGPRQLAGMINVYGEELMAAYASDSEGRFRDGEPLRWVLREQARTLQLLIHPIWWGEAHLCPGDRLQQFFEESTRGMAPVQATKFDDDLLRAIGPAKRSGWA